MPGNDGVRPGSKPPEGPPPKRPSVTQQPPKRPSATHPPPKRPSVNHQPPATTTQASTSTPPKTSSKHPKTPGESRRVILKKKRPPQPIEVLLGNNVINAAGDKMSPATFAREGSVVGLYFAAKWCPPCRLLFPQLMLLYEEVKKAEVVPFEMVFVSFDNTQESFDEYLAKMPWWAVEFQDLDKREEIAMTFGIEGIPVLTLLDGGSLEVITKQATAFLHTDPRGNQFPWRDLPTPLPSPPAQEAVAEALAMLASVAELLVADPDEMAADHEEPETSAAPVEDKE